MGRRKDQVADLIKLIAALRERPPHVLLPVLDLYSRLTTLLAGNSVEATRELATLRSVLSLCKIAESVIKTRHPKMSTELQRSESLMRCMRPIYKCS